MRVDHSIRVYDVLYNHFLKASCPLFSAIYNDHAVRSWRFAARCSQQTATYIIDAFKLPSDCGSLPLVHHPCVINGPSLASGGMLIMEDLGQQRDANVGFPSPPMLPRGGLVGIPRGHVAAAMIWPCQTTSSLTVRCLGCSDERKNEKDRGTCGVARSLVHCVNPSLLPRVRVLPGSFRRSPSVLWIVLLKMLGCLREGGRMQMSKLQVRKGLDLRCSCLMRSQVTGDALSHSVTGQEINYACTQSASKSCHASPIS